MRVLAYIVAALCLVYIVACDGDPHGDDTVPNRALELHAFAHALDALDASSPPVVESAYVYTEAVDCPNGNPCCDPNCPLVESVHQDAQACHDGVNNVSYVAVADDEHCYRLSIKVQTMACGAVRCQTTGCRVDEFFLSDCNDL